MIMQLNDAHDQPLEYSNTLQFHTKEKHLMTEARLALLFLLNFGNQSILIIVT